MVFRVGELHPKSLERYSKGDKTINWNPQERIRGEASSGSAATGIIKESELIEDSDTPLNESEHEAGQQYLDGYYERYQNSPDPRTLSTEEQRSLLQRMSQRLLRLCPTTVKRKRGSPKTALQAA